MPRSRIRTRRQKRAAEPPAEVEKKIVRRGSQHCVVSEDGSRSFGCYSTRAAAERRLRQVESFKVDEEDEDGEAALAKGLLPRVLSWTAVATGEMPEAGRSGMEKSLERDVPPRFRFWKAADPEAARSTRDALVEAQLFTPETIRRVDGKPRRIVEEVSYYLAKVGEGEAELAAADQAELAGARLVVSDADLTIVSREVVDALDPERVEKLLEKSVPWVAAVPSESDRLAAVREQAAKGFRLRTRPGVVFFTSESTLRPSALVVEEEPDGLLKALSGSTIELLKSEGVEKEERFVLGIVLEPDVVDQQKDTYDAATVRASAHKFMRDFRAVGLQHKRMLGGKAHVVESYLAPVAMDLPGRKVKAGTWLMGIVIDDDDVWKAVKDGRLTGLSIGGDAVRKPVEE